MRCRYFWVVGLTMVCLSGFSGPASGETMLWAGTREMGVSGYMYDDGDDIRLSLNGRFGYFPVDDVVAGMFLGGMIIGSDRKQVTGGLYAERNFYLGTLWVPHVGASLGFAWRDHGLESDQYAEFSTWAGFRFFFVDYAAIGLQAVGYVASDDIYNYNQDAFDWELRLSTNWYF